MSLRQKIASREAHIDKIIGQFSKEFASFSREVQREIASAFRSGDISRETLIKIFNNNGYPDIIDDVVNRQVEMLKYSSQISKDLGVKFIATQSNIDMFNAIQNITQHRLDTSMLTHIDDLMQYGIKHQLEQRSMAELTANLADEFKNFGRRVGTEAYTGISMSVNATDLGLYENSGIKLFVYVGPMDNKNRPACGSTLSDPRQQTGWTMEEVNASDTPFITVGGWNCRHRWMAHTGDIFET